MKRVGVGTPIYTVGSLKPPPTPKSDLPRSTLYVTVRTSLGATPTAHLVKPPQLCKWGKAKQYTTQRTGKERVCRVVHNTRIDDGGERNATRLPLLISGYISHEGRTRRWGFDGLGARRRRDGSVAQVGGPFLLSG
jgi:hypothetical protein